MKKRTPNKGNLQQQSQLSMQKVVQDQAYSYNIIGGSLSAFECYANRCQEEEDKKTNIFSAYNNFNCGNTKTLDQLKDQIIVQLIILNSSIQLYTMDHGEYVFPKNLSKDKIIELIETWKEWVPEETKKYYQSALDIFRGNKPQTFEKELESDKKKEINPNWFISQIDVIHQANKKGEDAVKKFDKDGKLPEMILNSEKVGDDNINKSSANEIKRREDQDEIDELLDKVETQLNLLKKEEENESDDIIKEIAIRKNNKERKKSDSNEKEDFDINQKKQNKKRLIQKQDYNKENNFIETIQKFSEVYDNYIEKYQIYIYHNVKKEHSAILKRLEKTFNNIKKKTFDESYFITLISNLNPSSIL